jgi:hypothetical protein
MGADDNIETVIVKLNYMQSDRFVRYERRETGMTTIKYTKSCKIFICVCTLAQIANKFKLYKITIVNMRSSPEFYIFTSLFFPPPPPTPSLVACSDRIVCGKAAVEQRGCKQTGLIASVASLLAGPLPPVGMMPQRCFASCGRRGRLPDASGGEEAAPVPRNR